MDADKIKVFFVFHVEKIILVLVLGASAYMIHAGLQKEDIRQTYQPDRLIDDANQVKAGVDENHNDKVLQERGLKFDITAEIIKRRAPVDPTGYDPKPYSPTPITLGARRHDPDLVAPRAVRVKGVLTSIAIRSDIGSVYPIADLEAAGPVKKKPHSRMRPSGRTILENIIDGGTDGDLMGSRPIRKLAQGSVFGMQPGPTKHIKNDTLQAPIPGVGYFIAGTAVVPYKELFQSYQTALAGADDYRPKRDQPIFTNYQVERADVTDKSVDQLVDADWVVRDNRTDCIRDAVTIWSGFAPEIVPKDYREDGTLTMWIPPVLLDDYSTFALHPLIPMKTPEELWREAEKARMKARSNKVDPEKDFDIADGLGPVMRRRMGMQRGRGNLMGGQALPRIAKERVNYKLIRFYDFAFDHYPDDDAPKAGRKYVYRVRVSLLDPNFPLDRRLQPRARILAPKVYDRVSLLDEAEKESYIRWSDWSEPSEPASLPGLEEFYAGPVTSKAKRYTVGNREVLYQTSPAGKMVVDQFIPSLAARMPMSVDVSEGTVLSKKVDAAEIVDPITKQVKKVAPAEIITGATIVDIGGGRPLEIEAGENMLAPGLMLLFDPNGGLSVHDEVGDQEFYRIKSFADERGE